MGPAWASRARQLELFTPAHKVTSHPCKGSCGQARDQGRELRETASPAGLELQSLLEAGKEKVSPPTPPSHPPACGPWHIPSFTRSWTWCCIEPRYNPFPQSVRGEKHLQDSQALRSVAITDRETEAYRREVTGPVHSFKEEPAWQTICLEQPFLTCQPRLLWQTPISKNIDITTHNSSKITFME